MHLEKPGCGLDSNRSSGGSCELNNKLLGTFQSIKFLDHVSNSQLQKKCCAQRCNETPSNLKLLS
jgi:hypothetical protein